MGILLMHAFIPTIHVFFEISVSLFFFFLFFFYSALLFFFLPLFLAVVSPPPLHCSRLWPFILLVVIGFTIFNL